MEGISKLYIPWDVMGVKLTPVVRPHGVSQAGSGVSIGGVYFFSNMKQVYQSSSQDAGYQGYPLLYMGTCDLPKDK